MRLFAVTLAATAALAAAVAGCGGSSSASDAKSAVNNYLTAFAKGDGKQACSLMTAETRTSFVLRARPITHTTDCVKSVALLKPALSRAFRGVKVSQAKVAGNEAVVTVKAGARQSPALVRKVGGHWKIAAAPGTQ